MRRSTRADYHRAVKMVKRNENMLRSEKMAINIHDNNRKFWSEVKRFTGKGVQMPYTVDGAVGNKEIASVFANRFKSIFNAVSSDNNALYDTQQKLNNLAFSQNLDQIELSMMVKTDLPTILKRFKSGKSDGVANLFSDHILHGTDMLYDFLLILFNAMIIHCVSPADMLTGTMVPIPKGRRCDTAQSDNFRGICLQSLLCKIIDIFMLNKQKHILLTSDNQFGFKEGISANMAASMVTETADYYLNHGGTVYALALDATKAFDRVEFNTLFDVLMNRGMNPLFTRLLFYMYTNQQIRVKYNGIYSDYFDVKNGVKQGGVISPTLFTCYIDGLLEILKCSGIGCKVGSMYTGCISYADDLVLLAPNLSALKEMIKICEEYASKFKIKFNGSKSNLMIYDKRPDKQINLNITVDNEPVDMVPNLKYLGHMLINDRSNPHTDSLCKDFVMKVNSFLGNFSDVSSDIKNELFQSYCTSFYGHHLCDFSKLDNIYVEWRKAIRRVWKIPRRTHSALLPHVIQSPPLPVILHQRFINFFYSGLCSKNNLVRFMFNNAICHNTRIGANLNIIMNSMSLCSCYVHNLKPDLLCKSISNKWWTTCTEDDLRVASQIREIVFMRDSPFDMFLNRDECKDLLYHLCTSTCR
jgi:PHP family Zn ribbon phosphoesterase